MVTPCIGNVKRNVFLMTTIFPTKQAALALDDNNSQLNN